MKIRKINPMILCGSIFLGIGMIFFLVGCSFFVIGALNKNKGEEITAVVTSIESYRESDGDIGHWVYVDYEYDGVEYTDMRLNYYSSSMSVGKKITITIDPDNPEKVLVSDFNMMFGGIFGGVGLVFAVTGGAMLLSNSKKKALAKRLVAEGYYIEASIECVDTVNNIRINGRQPYVIRCNYRNPDDGRLYSFTSEMFAFDPTPLIEGETLRVYVDRTDFTKNYVDVSEFKEKYIEC